MNTVDYPDLSQWVHRQANEFESAWQRALRDGSPPPTVTPFLDGVPATVRAAVEQELGLIDRECRKRLEEMTTGRMRVGKYQVVRPLGAGGQASAYLALDPDLQRHVVLKLYRAARAPEEEARVFNEGRALARVQSPYVAGCLGVERHDSLPCLVVEYVPGRSLEERLRAGPVGVAEALELTARLAEGLAAVHACGLLHRDVKPANVLLGDDGVPRLIDFGLAEPVGRGDVGAVCGTPAYMAPEQARGEGNRIDPRTDLFGLGAVLYHLLTGRPPYQADTREELWQAIRTGTIAPARTVNPKVPAAANALCMRCLAADPGGRFGSAVELARAVRRWQRRRRQRPWFLGAAAVGLVLAAIVAGKAVWPRAPVPEAAGQDVGLRRDFPLQVELIGVRKDSTGALYRITEGQPLSVEIRSPHTCYAGIWYENDEGKVYQLFPNDYDPDHRIAAGVPRLIPGDKDYQIRAAPANGPGRLRVLASTERWNPLLGRRAGPYVVFATPEELDGLRNFQIEALRKAVAEYVFTILVEPRQGTKE
jgi:hypothetical protein